MEDDPIPTVTWVVHLDEVYQDAKIDDAIVGRIWPTGPAAWQGVIHGFPETFRAGANPGVARAIWITQWRFHREPVIGYELDEAGVYLTGAPPIYLARADVEQLARELGIIKEGV